MDDLDAAPGGAEETWGPLLEGISDRGRGLLASALLAECGEENVVALLRLDSADPSLMSRADVARLRAHLHASDGAALERALHALREHPEMTTVLDGLFAPSRESSDTSNLGGDPSEQA